METCLVFPRLICKSQWGVGVPAFSGHCFKNLYILRCLYANFPAPQSAWQKQLETKGEQKELRDKVAAVISGAARILPGSPQPVRRMGAFSNVVAWVGPVL